MKNASLPGRCITVSIEFGINLFGASDTCAWKGNENDCIHKSNPQGSASEFVTALLQEVNLTRH